MKQTTRFSFLSVALSLFLLSCGGDGDRPLVEEDLNLSDVKAEDVRNTGMAIEMTGDTTGISLIGERVYSPDSSKVVYCEEHKLYIADADGSTSRLLHESTDDTADGACFGLRWSADGTAVSFTRSIASGDSLPELRTVTITLGKNSEDD